MQSKTWESIRRKKMSQERVERIRKSTHNEVIALTLRELREQAG